MNCCSEGKKLDFAVKKMLKITTEYVLAMVVNFLFAKVLIEIV